VQKQRQSAVKLGSRPNFRTDYAGFPNLSRSEAKNWNLPYISIGYGGEGVSQSPLKHKAFLTFLGQNPPFELRPNWRFASNLFMESIVGHTRGTGIDVYDSGLVYSGI
jgi:hypothetical protein